MKTFFPILACAILCTNFFSTNTHAQGGGFYSAAPSTVITDPGVLPPPISTNGTRLMWFPAKSALRAGTAAGPVWDADSIGTWSTAFGYNAVALGANSMAAGNNTRAAGASSTALGSFTKATGLRSLAAGESSRASGQASTALGLQTFASNQASFASGDGSVASGPTSTAMGALCVASGAQSVAMGNGATASGTNSVALGQDATASGFSGTAIGRNTFAAGGASALGYYANANGDYSTAIGNASGAFGESSMAMGGGASFGSNSTALGLNAQSAGVFSMAFGFNAQSAGYSSAAIGYISRARGDYSLAAGSYTFARAFSSTALGYFNDSIAASSPTATVTTDPLLYVGNGASGALNNAMLILKNGNTGIGTSSIAARLHVRTTSTITYPQLMLEDPTNNYARLSFKNSNTGNVWTVAAFPAATNSAALMNFYWQGFGDVLSLKGDGNATLKGTLTQSSDRRLKTDIRPVDGALAGITQLTGYRYRWSNPAASQHTQIGVIAQEVQALYPELVETDGKGMLSVNYSGLVPVLINALKEQQSRIEKLEADAGVVQLQFAKLVAEVDAIKGAASAKSVAKD